VTKYDDGLTEEQWLMAVDADDDSIEAAIARKETIIVLGHLALTSTTASDLHLDFFGDRVILLHINVTEEVEMEVTGRGARERKVTKYDDGLTEEQWLMALLHINVGQFLFGHQSRVAVARTICVVGDSLPVDGRGARERKVTKYDDGLTEEQWLMAVDADDDSIEVESSSASTAINHCSSVRPSSYLVTLRSRAPRPVTSSDCTQGSSC
jgi:hypothetical protein